MQKKSAMQQNILGCIFADLLFVDSQWEYKISEYLIDLIGNGIKVTN